MNDRESKLPFNRAIGTGDANPKVGQLRGRRVYGHGPSNRHGISQRTNNILWDICQLISTKKALG